MAIHAGALNQRLRVLECRKDPAENEYRWEETGRVWAMAEPDDRRTLFSSVGIGARGVTFTIRARPGLTLHQAFSWRGQHCFLTLVLPREDNRGYWTVKTAVCDPVTLTAKPQDRTGRDSMNRPTVIKQASFTFPGILTELYRRNEPDEIYRSATLQRALVTPKPIILRTGDLVQAGEEEPYTVRQVMDLDPWKNEYVIERQEDV